MRNLLLQTFLVIAVFLPAFLFAQTKINSKFTCLGSQLIDDGGALVEFNSIKKRLAKAVKKARAGVKRAEGKKKSIQKKKLKKARAALRSAKNCSSGSVDTLIPDSGSTTLSLAPTSESASAATGTCTFTWSTSPLLNSINVDINWLPLVENGTYAQLECNFSTPVSVSNSNVLAFPKKSDGLGLSLVNTNLFGSGQATTTYSENYCLGSSSTEELPCPEADQIVKSFYSKSFTPTAGESFDSAGVSFSIRGTDGSGASVVLDTGDSAITLP